MSTAKVFLICGIAVFAAVGLMGYFRRPAALREPTVAVQEVVIPQSLQAPKKTTKQEAKTEAKPEILKAPSALPPAPAPAGHLPDADRIKQLFATDSSKLPIVETVAYTSRAPWIKGRPAWIADYASYYNTSRHFIARSLNRKPDYFSQKVSPGDRFNVFKKEKNLEFYLLIDLSRCRMWFYYIDLDQNERVLLKTYRVGVGRVDPKRKSGFLSPIGKYSLGDKIAIYKLGTMGFFQDEKVEMLRVFGTRWIPFEKELEGCSEAAKGFGLHGAPWIEGVEREGASLIEDRSKVGQYDSDGCIRLASEDIEEIFSIVITKPTTVELVKDFHDAKMPGIEKSE